MKRRNFIKLATQASVAAAIAADPVARLSASIITRPKRQVDKPPGGLCVNWGHPLAMGMIAVIPFNEAGGIVASGNIVSFNATGYWPTSIEGPLGTLAGTPSWVTNTPGPGIRIDNTLDFMQTPGLLTEITTGGTALVIRRKTDSTQRAAATFGSTTGGTDLFSTAIPWVDGIVYWDFGGNAGANRLTYAGFVGAWNPVVEMWAFTAGGKGSSIWKDGQKLASQTTAITRTASGVSRLNSSTGGTVGDLQEFYFFAVSKTQWSDDLISWWFHEPYGMLVPQSPTMRYFFGGTGRKKTNVFVAM